MKKYLSVIVGICNKNKLIFSFLFIIATFAISRLPFFIYFSITCPNTDTFEYFEIVEKIINGIAPEIDYLPPFFPLFLFIVGAFSNKLISIVIVQNILSLFTALFFVFVLNRKYNQITFLGTIAISIFYASSQSLIADTTIMTESIYSNSLVIVVSLIILSLNSKRKLPWILLSIFFCFPILIRPNGIFIIPVIGLLLIYIFINKLEIKYYKLLLIPFTSIMILVSIYNIIISGSIIPRRYYSSAPSNHTNYLKGSNYKADKLSYKLKKSFSGIASEHHIFYYSELKWKYNYLSFLIKNIDISKRFIEVSDPIKKNTLKEYYNTPINIDFHKEVDIVNNPNAHIKTSILFKIYDIYYSKIHSIFFRNIIWAFIFVSVLIISIFKLYKSKLKNKEAFIIFILCFINIISLILVSIAAIRFQYRFIYPTEFTYYVSLAMLPLIYKGSMKEINK